MANQNLTQVPPKKLLVVNDIAGVGRCSMAVALPIISCCGVQACPIPTTVFSNHMAFATHYSIDLSSHLKELLAHLNFLPVTFDGICCGFLNSKEQVDILRAYFSTLDRSIPIYLDPVLGDNGKPYQTVTEELVQGLKQLLPYMSLITPNLTEACLLTDTPYSRDFTEQDAEHLCRKLIAAGAKKVVITGIDQRDKIANAFFEDSFQIITRDKVKPSRPGTGDIFFSILSALTLREFPLSDAVNAAVDFVGKCLTSSGGVPILEGVALEHCLHLLSEY